MIEFILGRTGYGKSERILEKIRSDYENTSRPLWLLVPEQQEIAWHLRAASLGPTIFQRLTIGGFSTIADIVFRQFGGLAYNYITDSGKALLLWRVLSDKKNDISFLKNTLGKENRYVPLFLDTIRELKAHRITPDILEEMILKMDDPTPQGQALLTRLQDLSVIYANYESALKERFSDRDDTLEHLLTVLKDHPSFTNSIVYIDSFYSVTPVQAAIIQEIMRTASDVTVSFTLDTDETEPQWGPCRRYYHQISEAAHRIGEKPQVTRLQVKHRCNHPELLYLEKNLWKIHPSPFGNDTDRVSIYEAKNIYDEAKIAASRVAQLVFEGCRYNEIAIIARNIESLHGVIDTTLASYQIPFYISEKMSLSQSPVSRLVFSALAVAEYGWQQVDVVSCAKTGLCALTEEETDIFERYVEKWKLRGPKAFSSDRAWAMNPAGFVDTISEEAQEYLNMVNQAKEKLCLPLEAFADALANTPTVRSVAKALMKLLDDYSVFTQLKKEADELSASLHSAEASQIAQVWKSLCDALDTMVDVLGDHACDAAEFSRLFKQVIHFSDISTIPSAIDQVLLGSAHRIRPDHIKHVILLGANEGEFPSTITETGYFTDLDREKLELEGYALSEGSQLKTQQEYFWFYNALAQASDSVTVIYPTADIKGDSLRPSNGVSQLLYMFPHALRKADTLFYIWNEASVMDTLRLKNNAEVSPLVSLLTTPMPTVEGSLSAENDEVSGEFAQLLYPNDLNLTQSRIEKFISCQFSYYCQYILHISDERPAEISPVDVGNYIHAILESYFREVSSRGKPLSEEESSDLINQIIDDYTHRVFAGVEETPRLSHMFSRLRGSASLFIHIIASEFAHSKFQPYAFEQPIRPNDPTLPPSLTVPLSDGKNISLIGTIDRVDTYETPDGVYVRVVDYKTGAKSFSLKDVSQGINMQMLLYLFSIWKMPACSYRDKLAKEKEIHPAGVLYFSARPGEMTSKQPVPENELVDYASSQVKREGLLLNDTSILEAMDTTGVGTYIPVSYDKKGNLKKENSLADEAQFETLYEEIKDTVHRIGESIISGSAHAQPLMHGSVSPCTYCSLSSICRNKKTGKEPSECQEN